MKRLLTLLMCLALVLLSIPAAVAEEPVTLTYAVAMDILSLDPTFCYDWYSLPVVNQICETVLVFDQNDQLQPGLASAWENPDPLTYVYQIRDNVTFSDGTPMTMDDVLFCLNRTKNPETASYLDWMFSSVESFEQTGDWELTAKLSAPDAMFKYTMATTAASIFSKAYFEAHPDDFGSATGGVMGTGPYVFSSWKSGTELVLEKNANYWNPESATGNIGKIVFKVVSEFATLATALKNGEVDFINNVQTDLADAVLNEANLKVEAMPTFGLHYLSYNTSYPPLDDVNARKALSLCIDREKLMTNIIKYTGQKGTELPSGESLWVFEKDTWAAASAAIDPYEYDLERAKECLAASQYPDGFEVTFTIAPNTLARQTALMLQSEAAKIGITVNITEVTEDENTALYFGGMDRNYEIILCSWNSDYPDPAGNLEPLFHSANAGEGGANAPMYQNPEFDALLDQSKASTDNVERTELLLKAVELLNADHPYHVLDYMKMTCISNAKLSNMNLGGSWAWNMYIKTWTMGE